MLAIGHSNSAKYYRWLQSLVLVYESILLERNRRIIADQEEYVEEVWDRIKFGVACVVVMKSYRV